MDLKKSESRSAGSSPKNSGQLSGGIGSKSKELSGNISTKDMFLRADKIDFKSWDVQLDKHLSRVWSRDREKDSNSKKEEWEIDLAKLDISKVIAHGTYGTVYRGVYDGQDVAVKVLDWGEDGLATVAETANLRTSFRQEVAVWHKLDHPNVTKSIPNARKKTPFKPRRRRPTAGFELVDNITC